MTPRIPMIAAVAATTLTVLFTGSPPLNAQTEHGGAGGHSGMDAAGSMSDASQAYMDAMSRMGDMMDGMAMTGEAGPDFAAMMIPHHQSAIDMAQAYLERGDGDPELTMLAEEIIEAQEREIAFLEEWLERNGE